MGSSRFPGRQPRTPRDLARVSPTRRAKDRVLIVCEGAKTEPIYFRELASAMRLTSADVEICGEECSPDPTSVVDHALKRFKQDPDIDRIFCVFDKDSHTTYAAACDRVRRKQMPKGKRIDVVRSVPCFEYWILLHFEYTCSPFVGTGSNSPCDSIIQKLKQHIPNYHKGRANLHAMLTSKTQTAITHAKIAQQAAQSVGTDNPTTETGSLVEYLIGLSQDE